MAHLDATTVLDISSGRTANASSPQASVLQSDNAVDTFEGPVGTPSDSSLDSALQRYFQKEGEARLLQEQFDDAGEGARQDESRNPGMHNNKEHELAQKLRQAEEELNALKIEADHRGLDIEASRWRDRAPIDGSFVESHQIDEPPSVRDWLHQIEDRRPPSALSSVRDEPVAPGTPRTATPPIAHPRNHHAGGFHPVPGRPYWFYDRSVQQYFRYDPQSDQLFYNNGLHIARPANVPRSFYLQAHQQNYRNLPPTSHDGHGQNNANFALATGSSTRPQYSQDADPFRPLGRYQSQPSVDATAASMQGLSLRNSASQPRTFERNGVSYQWAQNPQSQVQTLIGTGSAEMTTDPELLRGGVRAHQRVYGSESEFEHLYSNFRLQQHSFFAVGRVFSVLWAEPAGESKVTIIEPSDASTIRGRYNQRVFSKVRRFVVVRTGRDYCSALPIMTYGGRGVAKPGINKSEHAIVYTGSQPPRPLPTELPRTTAESPMQQHAVRVVPDDRESKLDPMSRIDFGKVHTVQHNIKARPFGMVHQQSMEALVSQVNNVWLGTSGSSADNAPTASTSRSASGSGAASSRSRMPVDSKARATRRGASRSGGKLGAVDSDQEEDSESGSEGDGSESDDNRSQRTPIEAVQMKQAYARLRSQGLSREQTLASMATMLRRTHPSLTQEAVVARIRTHLSSS